MKKTAAFLGAAALALLAGQPSQATGEVYDADYEATTIDDGGVVDVHFWLRSGCRQGQRPDILNATAQHGEVTAVRVQVKVVPFDPLVVGENFDPNECVDQIFNGTGVHYEATGGYTGPDTITYTLVLPGQEPTTITKTINVI